MNSNKSINIENLKDFIKNILPKYITNKDVLDKISYDQNAGTIKIDDNVIHLINDNIVSDQSTFSSNKSCVNLNFSSSYCLTDKLLFCFFMLLACTICFILLLC